METIKILQIIPAPTGTNAVHEGEDGKMYEEPIVALALVEGDGVRNVVAMEMDAFGEVCIAQDSPNFAGLLFNGDHIRQGDSNA